jgi:hypothetical protein
MSITPPEPSAHPSDLERWRTAARIVEGAVHRFEEAFTALRGMLDQAERIVIAEPEMPTATLGALINSVRKILDGCEVANLLARRAEHEREGRDR